MSEIQNHETLDNTREIQLNELKNPEIGQLWQVGSWLPEGEHLRVRLSHGGETGVTRDELIAIEKLSGRYTAAPDADIPLYLDFIRNRKGDQARMVMSRYSATDDVMQPVWQLDGDLIDFRGQVQTLQSERETAQAIMPVVKKLAPLASEIIANKLVQEGTPNNMLKRTYFTTNRQDTWWLQLESPAAEHIQEDPEYPYRRLYVNANFQSTQQYGKFVKELVATCREYTADPLMFKALFAGDGAEEQILDPEASKIVFYFHDNDLLQKDGKIRAREFAQWLMQQPVMNGLPTGDMHEIAAIGEGGMAFGGNNLLLGKGMKEDRARVVKKLKQVLPGEAIPPEVLRLANQYSIRYDNGDP